MQEFVALVDDDVAAILSDIVEELAVARGKFPGRRLMTIALVEEVGELAKATLDETSAAVRREAVQTAVMAIRCALDGDESADGYRAAKGLSAVGTI